MAISPYRPSLYRSACRGVTWLVLICTAGLVFAQFARKSTISKGPRALGLLVMNPQGKPRLIPIAIMVDGRFYDASAYKASPVPMALDAGTVYEAERTGNSLGLFTVKQVLQQKNKFIAEGTFLKNGETPPSTGNKAESKPREGEEDKPPVLRRSKPEPTKAAGPPMESKPATPPPAAEPAEPPTTAKSSGSADSATAATPAPVASDSAPEDANRPILKRGIPPKPRSSSADAPPPAPRKPPKTVAQAAAEVVTAISDAGGPEPKPFTYDIKADEEQAFRTSMLTMAAEELRRYSKMAVPNASSPRTGSKLATKKPPEPVFNDIQLHVFDVSLSNEPVLVLSATARWPHTLTDAPERDYFLTLVARSSINGGLRKLMSAITDPEHMDIAPRMELIDAVDADGDGRAELLFRQISDAGTAYSIYRVHPDQLYSLYEGAAE